MGSNVHYDIEQEPIVLSKALLDLLFKQENSGFLTVLYLFYYYTARWQKTNQPHATASYVAEGLGWSVETVRKYKKQLIDLGLLENVVMRNEANQVTGHYIFVRFIWSHQATAEVIKNLQRTEKPDAGESQRWTPSVVNKYNNNKNNNLRAEEEATKEKYITKTMFDDFWELYPKKVDKGKALTAWNKIVSRKNDRPTWREVKKAIIYQKKTERWQDRKFIPHPTTWLNQNRWLDDPAEMKSIDRSSTNKPDKRMEGGEWYYLTATSSGNHYYVSKSGKILDE